MSRDTVRIPVKKPVAGTLTDDQKTFNKLQRGPQAIGERTNYSGCSSCGSRHFAESACALAHRRHHRRRARPAPSRNSHTI
jgi:hypothetical protein